MKHIGIIGAGISGLTTAKTFLQKGYQVTVLEKADGIGGVWQRSCSSTGVTTQTTRDEYAFSDLDRKSVVEGKSVSVRVDLGGRRIIKKKKKISKKEHKEYTQI